jgi:hypothetical protein
MVGMCEDCEEASLAAVYVRKMNRYGWRPPAAATTMPRLGDGRVARSAAPAFACTPPSAEPSARATAKVDRCA